MAFDCRLEEVKLDLLSSVGRKRRGRGTVHPGSGGVPSTPAPAALSRAAVSWLLHQRRPMMADRSHVSAQMRSGSQLNL